MDGDERDIFQFLKTWGSTFVGAVEIARRAGSKKRYHEDPNWAKPVLSRMADRGILEGDPMGRFRIKPISREERKAQWSTSDTAKNPQESGGEAEGDHGIAPDEYYDEL